ncbi:MAG TPA: hypothetical protein VGB77_00425 [Abditibacteriaceae bacterium]|jgi:hypothetical protein
MSTLTASLNGAAVDVSALRSRVQRVVSGVPVYDIHTHLYAPAFKDLLLFGLDEQLIYHYLVAEAFRHFTLPYEDFWKLPQSAQAEMIWQALFIHNTPLSEPTRGVLTCLHKFGLDPQKDDLPKLRQWFSQWSTDEYVDKCMEMAGVHTICMTNSPFDDLERPVWEAGYKGDSRFSHALRIDPLLMDWENTAPLLAKWGYEVQPDFSGKTNDEVQRFLRDWAEKMNALYVMVSLPPEFAYPANSPIARLIDGAILPFCRQSGLPFALMFGVRRAVNPELKLAGDGVGLSDLLTLQTLCAQNSDIKFLVTVLARENQHELAVLARKFRNLHIFGLWWFMNVPELIDETTRMRLELLGPTFTAQHSDSRVLDQIIYKWGHSRQIIGEVLADKYADLAATGWNVDDATIERDARQLLGGSFEAFLKR